MSYSLCPADQNYKKNGMYSIFIDMSNTIVQDFVLDSAFGDRTLLFVLSRALHAVRAKQNATSHTHTRAPITGRNRHTRKHVMTLS